MLATKIRLPLLAATIMAAMAAAPDALGQTSNGTERAGTELGNFGDVPFANPQIIITRADDRATWRRLEDKHLKERRDLEDKYESELRTLRARQALERDAALKGFAR